MNVGVQGGFFDRGIALVSIVKTPDRYLLYFLGWNKAEGKGFRNAIGVAHSMSSSADHFSSVFQGPILDRSVFDPFSLSYPFVLPPSHSEGCWEMIYGTNRIAAPSQSGACHVLSRAKSADGYIWQPTGETLFELANDETGHSRPWIFQKNDKSYLFFSTKTDRYRLDMAEKRSDDAVWQRTHFGIEKQFHGFEEDSASYPCILDICGRVIMFFNGSNYGSDGIFISEVTNFDD